MGREIQALAPAAASVESDGDWKKLNAADFDLVIDFSTPDGLSAALEWCAKNGKPLLSGTTGLSAAEKTAMKKAAAKIPVLYSANMSLGIAALNHMLETFRRLPDWDFQIQEAHHSGKKDKPSGTALLLQETLAGVAKKRPPEPLSVRGGGIAGIHQIWAMAEDEAIILQHTAFNRRVFARGALYAAQWLIDKKEPGLYDLSDLYKMT
jgi:4-hydroxy-tetrahydrodipicolinate reductase